MKMLSYAAVLLGLMLVLSTVLITNNVPAIAAKQKATTVTIDEVPTKVRPGDKVTFTGMLTTVDGEPMNQVPVNIYLLTSDPQLIVAATGVTGIEGTYEIVWDVQLIPIQRASSDVTKSVDTQVMSLFAQFEGNDDFGASKTGKSTVTIEVNSVKTFVNSDKKIYNEGDSALIFIGFTDADDEFVDPDWIQSTFNLEPITDQLEKKKVGSYTYMTAPLARGHNQITVIPHKEGYNIQVEVVTITVKSTGSAGVFEFP